VRHLLALTKKTARSLNKNLYGENWAEGFQSGACSVGRDSVQFEGNLPWQFDSRLAFQESIAMMPLVVMPVNVVIDIDIVDPVSLSVLAERQKNRRNCDQS
jgi:hypothetical protein